MRRFLSVLLITLVSISASFFTSTNTFANQNQKEWTFLVYLNGNNSLDTYGALNINQMEKVGSTDKVNIVVQWASLEAGKTVRLLVTKDNDFNKVTSKIIQDMGKVDMGDWRTIVDFVRWGNDNFPAKHVFLNVWDHGGGWHRRLSSMRGSPIHATDISWDDNTGHHITTPQLGMALKESAKVLGHKVDIYGSDACLMAMAEVANEMADSVGVYLGSEEVEPGAGWPYTEVMQRWTAADAASASDVARILTEEYVKSYNGGSNGNSEVTFSAFDLSKMAMLNGEVGKLASSFMTMDKPTSKKIMDAAAASQSYYYHDYVDLGDFLEHAKETKIAGLDVAGVKSAIKEFVIAVESTADYKKSTGVAIWLPTSSGNYDEFESKYLQLDFQAKTKWADALKSLLQ